MLLPRGSPRLTLLKGPKLAFPVYERISTQFRAWVW
jgi:hypothetical protein